jgi:signal transduction histidine kinase
MSSKRGPELLHTVTVRLALRHAGLFAILSLATFALVYLTLQAALGRRTDTELREDVHEMEGKLHAAPGRKAAVFRADIDAPDAGKEFRVLAIPGTRTITSDLTEWREVELIPAGLQSLRPGQEGWRTIDVPVAESRARVLARRTADGDLLEFGSLLADNEQLLEEVRRIFLLGWIATIVPGLLLGWFMARRAMAGVDRVTATAVRIGRGDLEQRVPVGHEGEEIEHLARAFNEMLDRIHLLVRELKDVTSHIAHDLKSPIGRIRAMAESATRERRESSLDESGAHAIIEDCDRLVAMVDTILEIAATDAGVTELAPAAVDLTGVARDAVDLFTPVAEDKGVRLTLALPAAPLLVRGDVSRVQRVVANLLDNAIKFTGRGGSVEVSGRSNGGRVSLAIADTGVGINAEALPRVFERFYRGDASRSTPGHGLGLSLARAIVRAYDGEITVESRAGAGSVFTIVWPAWPSASPAGPVTERNPDLPQT